MSTINRKAVPEKGAEQEQPRSGLASCLLSLFFGIDVWLIATAVWESRNWNDLKMNEIVNQLAASIEGVGNNMVGTYLRTCVLPGVLAASAMGVVLYCLRQKRRFARGVRIGAALAVGTTVGLMIYGVVLLDVVGYVVDATTESDYIEKNYADPKTVPLHFPEQKRNLIYIWLESMETTYADKAHGGAFDKSPIPELIQLAEENTSFTGTVGGVNGGCSMAGTTWTAGALFGHTSGLPLKIPIADSAMSSQEAFFPGVTSLGDILAEQGYRQALLIGSSANFGGRQLYFGQHGGYDIWDYPYSLTTGQLPQDYYVWWGYEDLKLFAFAQEHLTELAASGEPFNLSMLTVDTHFPDGYVCPLCTDEFGADQYSNVMACSSRQVMEFVRWVQQQPFYENTTIVISGDHITMDADYCDHVDDSYQRRVYTTIINPAAEVEDASLYRNYTTFDLFPTTLAALGVEIEGNRLGLGVNLFSRGKTLLERDGFARMNAELSRKSDFINALSGIDPAVYEMSEAFANTRTQLSAAFAEDRLDCTISGLSDIEQDFTKIELFAELMEGDTRTTLWLETAERQPDGSYTVTIPLDELDGNDTFYIHFYATTSAGRIRVDTGYLCDVIGQTLTREEEAD